MAMHCNIPPTISSPFPLAVVRQSPPIHLSSHLFADLRSCSDPPTPMASSLLLSSSSPNLLLLRSCSLRRFPYPRLQDLAPASFPSALSVSLPFSRRIRAGGSPSVQGTADETPPPEEEAAPSSLGEDSAAFALGEQKIVSWAYFSGILGAVLYALNVLWIDPATGFGGKFLDAVSGVSESPEVVLLALLVIFATVHSGLASLRDAGEKLVGERAYRVLFAGVSLPLAVSTIVYFINHRYDGTQLWQVQGVTGVHELVWISSFISFFFLYPSTFNLLEIAAVDKPKMHLWETGIMRITRHPQMVGQVIWCLVHTLWIGNTVAITASVGLIAHHLFGVWNGDRRLASRYGKAFEALRSRTSIIPFAAILDGRQQLPKNYYKEFIRLPYLAITGLTLGAYFAHPLMQSSSFNLHW